ncbi:MAG TPA: sulfatase [Actinomycetota bacterium]|nr:sulfatase [Actinomycetota bacterium]
MSALSPRLRGPRPFWFRTATVLLLCLALVSPPAGGGAASARRPNVLIFVTDDQRGGLAVMPKTLALLGGRGTRYANAVATTPVCCPSRASIFTGRYAHNHEVTSNTTPRALDQETTLQFYLDRAGYRTGIFGKYLNSWLRQPPPYFDRWGISGPSKEAYSGGEWNVQGTIRTVSQYATRFIGDQARSFLTSGSRRPWFLYLAPPNPHVPYRPEPAYANARVPPWTCNPAVLERNRSDKPPYVRLFNRSCTRGQEDRLRQFRTLMSVDDLVARVLRAVRATGERRDTLVFFLSDNGYLWGEHGLGGKRYPYLQSIQIPMLARWPGHIRAGAVDRRLVANIDVAPTVLDAVGLRPDVRMDGRSLLSRYKRDRILSEYWSGGLWSGQEDVVPDWASLLTKRGHLVRYYTPGGAVAFTEFYDLGLDPWELSNRAPPQGWVAQLSRDRTCRGRTCP